MFTGLIQEVGRVLSIDRKGRDASLSVECGAVIEDAKPGDSIAVDGACVTVESLDAVGFSAFLSPETLDRTTLGRLKPGDGVNLEAALRQGDRLGGHMVQGHVEGVGRVRVLKQTGRAAELIVEIPPDLRQYVIPKGSIALAGISLTVAGLGEGTVEAAVIPATLDGSTMRSWQPGKMINVETDMIGRYIVAYLKGLRPKGETLSVDKLKEMGF
jgi:riboflavin synthase